MAFVYMSDKRWTPINKIGAENVGPGSYETFVKTQRVNPMQQANAPFNKGDLRDLDKLHDNNLPGPGDYSHEPNFKKSLDART